MTLSVQQLKIRTDNRYNYLMVVLVAFTQGSMDLCSLSYFYIYFYDLGCSPSTLSLIQGLTTLPWCLKPFFGYLSDHIPFMGYKKKSYLFSASVIEFVTHMLMFRFRFGSGTVLLIQLT